MGSTPLSAFFLLTGKFPGDLVYPAGLVANPYFPDEGVRDLLTNQTLRDGRGALDIHPGDFVFYYNWQANVLSWLDTVDLFRRRKLVGSWATFREGRGGMVRAGRA